MRPQALWRVFLSDHQVKIAFQMGCANLNNGKLRIEAARHFDAFITIDLNIRYQQNLSWLPLPVLTLVAVDNDLETLRCYATLILKALTMLRSNALLAIHADDGSRL